MASGSRWWLPWTCSDPEVPSVATRRLWRGMEEVGLRNWGCPPIALVGAWQQAVKQRTPG